MLRRGVVTLASMRKDCSTCPMLVVVDTRDELEDLPSTSLQMCSEVVLQSRSKPALVLSIEHWQALHRRHC